MVESHQRAQAKSREVKGGEWWAASMKTTRELKITWKFSDKKQKKRRETLSESRSKGNKRVKRRNNAAVGHLNLSEVSQKFSDENVTEDYLSQDDSCTLCFVFLRFLDFLEGNKVLRKCYD